MAWHSGKPADGDFLSVSVQHIRENFAELEPLHPHIGELVDLTTLHPHVAELVDLTGLHPRIAEIVDLTALQPHISALLNSRIVEIGSNANGQYVRWENGLQVCWNFFYENRSTTTATGPLYRDDAATMWTFPAAFITSPAVYGTVSRPNDDSFRLFFAPNSVTTTSVTYRDVATASGSNLGRADQLLALGRWK